MIDRDKRRRTFLLLTVIGLLCCLSLAYDPSACIRCRKSHVCNPPDCFCCRDEMPIQDQKIPQMVFFTFDDAVNPPVAAFYRELFDASRLNPNGCPIKMTLFISHASTVYSLVREFYEKGMEIASHSVNHRNPDPKTFLNEAKKQKENLVKKAKIPEGDIKGWRSPFLKPLGDIQPEVLKTLGYEYDATLTIIKPNSKDKAPMPFTLDYGWPYDCKIKPCPKKHHKGFWEVPVISVRDYVDKYNCVYIDGCNIPPPSEALAYKFLWDNFENYYKTNRAPMGINMHASWFYYPDRKKAMSRFIQDILKLGDVYIVTVSQVIEWLRNPTPLSSIKDFGPWQCNGNSSVVPPKTVDMRMKHVIPQNQKRPVSPTYQIIRRRQQASIVPVRPATTRTRQTIPPSNPAVIYRQPMPTRPPIRNIVPTTLLRKMPNVLEIRPTKSNIGQGVNTVHQVHAHGRPEMVNMRPEIHQRIAHLLPPGGQVPIFPWVRQPFVQHAAPQPPLAPNYPVVRFWWRAPEVRLPHQPPGIHVVRPDQHIVSQQDIQQDMRRYQQLETQRNANRQLAITRQQIENAHLMKRRQELRRLNAIRQQNEILQRQERERQRVEELKRQEELARRQELEMKRKLRQQNELERLRQIEMHRQKEQARQHEQQRQQLMVQTELEKQRQLGLKRQQDMMHLRSQQIQLRNDKQTKEMARKVATVKQQQQQQQQQQNQIQVNQLFVRNKNIKALPQKQNSIESQKIIQLRQMAESNFLKLQEMERQRQLQTTTKAPRNKIVGLTGKPMWQMDISALKQLNVPWQTWISDSRNFKRNNNDVNLAIPQLSELNVEPKVKVERLPKKRVETLANFKPQTVFSVSDFQGSKSYSIIGKENYFSKDTTTTNVPSTLSTTRRSENTTTATSRTTTQIHSINVTPGSTTLIPKINQQSEVNRTIQLIAAPSPTIVHIYTRKPTTQKTASKTETTTTIYNFAKTDQTTKVDKLGKSDQMTTMMATTSDPLLTHVTTKPPHKTTKRTRSASFRRMQNNHIIYLSGKCIQGENCKLPACMCKQTSPPKGLLPQNTPQIVYITIDGNINFHTYANIKKIFQKKRVNPNGCPIKGTLFATDADSNYMIMKMLHSDGFELAMKGMKNKAYQSPATLEYDIGLQKRKLEKSGNIPSKDIKGWRSPDLKPLGDKQFEVLGNASLYDSTLIVGKDHRSEHKLWPFTLDYGWRERCEIELCPYGNHPGVWEVPIIPVDDTNNTRSCEYADSCTNQPNDVQETTDFLMNNFNQYYKSNRAPFAIRLQQVWFHWHYTNNLEGLNKFIDEILKLDDVYVITVSEMLDWMKNPTPQNQIKDFKPWSC